MSHRIVLAAGVAAAFSAPLSARAQVLTEHDVSVEMAMTIATTAMEACTKRVSVAVLDRTGRMRVFLQGDGAMPSNIELARRKAYTALTFGRTSKNGRSGPRSKPPASSC